MLSRSTKPEGTPVMPPPDCFIVSSSASASSSRTDMGRRSPVRRFWAMLKTLRSASSSSSATSPVSWLARSRISRPAPASRRRVDWFLMIFAYSTAFCANGTA
jgi:hypothetical protein